MVCDQCATARGGSDRVRGCEQPQERPGLDRPAWPRALREHTAAAPPGLEARPATDDLAAKGAVAKVDGVERIAGHLVAKVTSTNPTSTAIEVGPGSGLTEEDHIERSH